MRNASYCCDLGLTEKARTGPSAETMSWWNVWDSSSPPCKAHETLRKRGKNVWTRGWRGIDVFWVWHSHCLRELSHCIRSYLHKSGPVKISSQEKDALMLFSHWKFFTFFDCINWPCQFLRVTDINTNEESKAFQEISGIGKNSLPHWDGLQDSFRYFPWTITDSHLSEEWRESWQLLC